MQAVDDSSEIKFMYMKQISFLLAVTIYLVACSGKASVKTGLEGKLLPAFNILLPDSTTYFNIASVSAEKPVVLFYLSPQCPYCRAQLKDIIDHINELKGVQFYLVTSFPVSEMRQFSNEYKLDRYPNIIIGKDSADVIANYFEAIYVPYTAIFGKDRKLRKTYEGRIYSRQIKSVIED